MDTGGQNITSSSSAMVVECGIPGNATVPTPLVAWYATVEIICAVLSVFGNSVIIFLFAKKHSLRTVKNCYVISLASADLLVGLVGIPSALTVSVGLPRDFYGCLMTTSVLMILCTASILSLVAVTVDRFWCVTHPLTYQVTMTHGTARGVIFVCWLLSGVIGLLPLLGWNRGRPQQQQQRCFFVEVTHPVYLVFIFFGTIVGPTLLMAGIYFVIFCQVRSQSQKLVRRCGGSTLDLSQLKTTTKTVKSIFIVFVVFVASWFPLYVINTFVYFRPDRCISSTAFHVAIILSHLNSVWNPIVYGRKMKDFRLAIRKLFRLPVARGTET